VFKPSSGDVYVLLYVDHHDDAYRWAENRKLTINPVTGAMQMVTLEQRGRAGGRGGSAGSQGPDGAARFKSSKPAAAPLFGELLRPS
jgi:hypothetical protein